ncbi:MAG: cell division protein FtsW [Treponema sp.]|nr:cell division protein FtsW [Treponema sp.]
MSNFRIKPGLSGETHERDGMFFLISVLILWGLGILTLFVCTPSTAERLFVNKYYFVTRQLIFSAVGFVGLIFFAIVPLRFIRKILPVFVVGTFLSCFLPLIPKIGTTSHGASRWVIIPHVGGFQPSEFAKFAVVLYLANLFEKYLGGTHKEEKNFLYPLLGLFAFVIVVFLQKDFSTGLFIFVVGVIMFFVSGAKMNWFVPLVLLAIPCVIFLIAIEPYRIERLMSHLHPDEFELTIGYQRNAAARAIVNGGLWGNGMGSGLTSIHIPEIQTDYIFAGWCNAMGLLGVGIYFALIVFFSWRGYLISFSTTNRFCCYGSFGCTTVILLQSIINIGVVCGFLPTTGIPLPFFSSGGSSLIVTMAMCGFIINCSHSTEDDGEYISNYEENTKTNSKFETIGGVVVENYE